MKRIVTSAALLALAMGAPALAQEAKGTPQRGAETPPGLAKLLADPNHGILRAVIATLGSNSRLQDPVSP